MSFSVFFFQFFPNKAFAKLKNLKRAKALFEKTEKKKKLKMTSPHFRELDLDQKWKTTKRNRQANFFETNKTETTSNLKSKWTKKQRLKPKIKAHDQQRTKEHILISDDQAEVKTRDGRFHFVVFRFWYWDFSWIEFRIYVFQAVVYGTVFNQSRRVSLGFITWLQFFFSFHCAEEAQ